MDTSYRFGIEEEFFLADAGTRGTPRRTVKAFHDDVHARPPPVERELLEAQVEIASSPSTSFAEARSTLAGLRASLAAIGQAHGVLLLAAGTHPIARWAHQSHTRKRRYEELTRDLRMLARRDVVCGMHVHVEVPRPEERVDLMNRLLPYMPVLLALSASSPFWQGQATGLAAYRLSVWGEMPRTGLPDLFQDAADYERYVATMVRCGAIADASFLWWTLRPSTHFPTLELRVADSCTRLEDALAIAALYRCLVRLAVRRPELNRGLTGASRALTSENLWRAQRDGIHASFLDEESDTVMPFATYLNSIIAEIVMTRIRSAANPRLSGRGQFPGTAPALTTSSPCSLRQGAKSLTRTGRSRPLWIGLPRRRPRPLPDRAEARRSRSFGGLPLCCAALAIGGIQYSRRPVQSSYSGAHSVGAWSKDPSRTSISLSVSWTSNRAEPQVGQK